MELKAIEASVRAIQRTCRGYLPEPFRSEVNKYLGQGKTKAAQELDSMHRVVCEFDFNNIILAGPLDGQEHAYTCPRCGVEGTYVAPRFDSKAEGKH